MALPIAAGLDPTYPALLLGMASTAAALLATWSLARSTLESEFLAWLSVVLVASNFTFLCFAATTLETMLQVALVTVGLALAAGVCRGPWRPGQGAALSVCWAAALLVRLDSAVFALLTGVRLLANLNRTAPREEQPRRLAWLVLPGLGPLGAWIVWKLWYYGDLLPNTWYAREAGMSRLLQWGRGLRYVGGFLSDYWLWPLLLPALVPVLWRRRPAELWLSALVLAWCIYVVHCGADYMEYRFMAPLLPALSVLLLSVGAGVHRAAVAGVVAVMLAASVVHGRINDGSPLGHGRLDYRIVLEMDDPSELAWARFGRFIAARPDASSLVWTLPQLGLPGYYTGFRIVDLHGLTDRWVARHGLVRHQSPGHDKYAPLEYLRARGVHLADTFGVPCYWYGYYKDEDLSSEVMVTIHGQAFWYLTPHPVVDRLLAEGLATIDRFPARDECLESAVRGHLRLPGPPPLTTLGSSVQG
jgi:arabinofuranosyltransferase